MIIMVGSKCHMVQSTMLFDLTGHICDRLVTYFRVPRQVPLDTGTSTTLPATSPTCLLNTHLLVNLERRDAELC